MSKLERQLFVRLLWSLLAVLLLLSVFFVGLAMYKTQKAWQNNFTEAATMTARALKSLVTDLAGSGSDSAETIPNKPVVADLLRAAQFTDYENSVVLDGSQRVLYNSAGAGYNLTPEDIARWNERADKANGAVVDDNPTGLFEQLFQTTFIRAVTFDIDAQHQRYTLITAAQAPHIFQLFTEVAKNVLLMVVAAFVILALSLRFFIRKILNNINIINDFLVHEAQNPQPRKLELSTGNELQTIAEHLNYYIEELEKRNTQQVMFSANASHQLRTPLTVISSHAQALAAGIATADEVKEFGETILKNCERMQKTTDALLLLTRIDSQSIGGLPKTLTNIAALVREQLDAIVNTYSHKGLVIERIIPDELYLDTNPQLITQVIHNILENAAKYTLAAGRITVKLYEENARTIFSVKDSGIGIAKDDLPRIFDRFYRADKSHSQTVKGSGLGLAIVRQIVDLLGGEIIVNSEEGTGTEFIVIFPG
ncbi:MAG: HAMP domain-containing sensor histidine kinase [Bacillota bacterium]